MQHKKNFLIVDDHPIFIQGLQVLIESNPRYHVVNTVATIDDAITSFRTDNPDITLVDISLAEENGLELVKTLKSLNKKIPVLIISMYDEMIYAERAIKAGANGYVMKQEAAAVMLRAIQKVLEGEVFISERMNARILQSMLQKKENADVHLVEKLSDRELEVLEYIGQGYGASEISELLNLSVKTINTYRDHIKDKLHLDTASDVRRFAVKWFQSRYM